MIARNHHYVPQVYLRRFGTKIKKEVQVSVFDRYSHRKFRTSVKNVAAERDFNLLEVEGVAPDAMETELSKFEGQAGEAISRTEEAGRFVNSQDRALILELAAMMAVRNPRRRETTRSFVDTVTKIVLDTMLSSDALLNSTLDHMIRDGKCSPEDKPHALKMAREAHQLVENIQIGIPTTRYLGGEEFAVDAVYDSMQRRGWHLVSVPEEPSGFITSDNPILLISDAEPVKTAATPFGFASAQTLVIFPLTNRIALLGRFDNVDGEYEVGKDMMAVINGATALHATRQVYARDDQFSYRVDGVTLLGSSLVTDTRFLRT